MKKKHSLTYNGIMNLIYTGSRIVFPLITAPYLARTLGAANTGRVDFALSVVSYFMLFASLGIPTYGIRVCAEVADDKVKLSKAVHELLIFNAIFMFISVFIYFIFIFNIPRFTNDMSLFLMMSLLIPLRAFGVEWFYQGIEQYDYITIRTLIAKTVSVLLIFIAVHSPDDYIWYAASSIILEAGSNLCNLWNLRKYIFFNRLSKYDLKKHTKPVFVFFLSSIAINIYNQMDVTMLGIMKNASEVGFYEYGIKIVKIIWIGIIGLTTVTMPRIVYFIQNSEYCKESDLRKKGAQGIFLITLPIILFVMFFGDEIITFFFGKEYVISAMVLRIASIAVLPVAYSNYLANFILLPRGRDKQRAVSVNIGLFINLIFNNLLIPVYGAVGATIATVFTETVVCCCLLISARDYLKDSFTNFRPLKKLIILSGSLLLLYEVYHISLSSLFLRLPVCGLLFFSGYIVLLIICREELLTEQIKKHLHFK